MKKVRIGILMLVFMLAFVLSGKTPVFATENGDKQVENVATGIEKAEDEGIGTMATIKYTIKFDGNKATSGKMSSLTSRVYGKSYTLPTNGFKRKGYSFTGWNTKADGSGKTYKNKATVKNLTNKNGKTVTLYAQWKKTKYTITYELKNGKNNSSNPAHYYVTTSTITLKNPTRTGYTFKGWYSDSEYKNKVTEIKNGSTGNKKLYAKWSLNKYTIKFDANGGTGTMSSLTSRKYGTTYTLSANKFTRKGYKFNGWNTKADGSGKDFADKVKVKNLSSKNGTTVTLYAQWKKTKYTITYELNGGKNNSSNPTYYYVTTSTIKLKNPTRKGYSFVGWYSDSSFKNKVTEIKKGTTGSKTLYAKWKKATAVTLTVWCPDYQYALVQKQQKAFSAEHPEWSITWNTALVGEDVAYQELEKDPEAGADVFFYANDQVRRLVKAGAIAQLDGSVADMVNETISANIVDTVKIGNKLYGIPYTHNTFFMYYDKSILSKKDVKSLDTILAKETKNGVYNFRFDDAGGWKLGAWYYGAGLSVFGKEGDDLSAGCDWNSKTGVAVTKYLIDMINNKKVNYVDDVYELVADRKLGAWFDGAWNYEMYKSMLGDDLGMAPIPTYGLNGTQVQLKGFYGTKAIGVNAKSDYLEVAKAFAEFIGTEEQQLARYEATGEIPTNKNAGKSEVVTSNPLAAVIVAEANNCSVAQPTSDVFNMRYWVYASAIPENIRSGQLTSKNAQEFMDMWVKALCEE